MKNWKDLLIPPTTSILKVIEAIDAGAMQIALVVDPQRRLLGTVTDGDIRRGILKGIGLGEAVLRVMKEKPITAGPSENREELLAIMKQRQVRQIPLLDENGCVMGIELLENLVQCPGRQNWAFLVVGGLGSRLRPLTEECPKPLLKVGNKPLLEIIIQNIVEYGFRKFYMAVNYKDEMIRDYFGDGSKWGVEIRYIREETRLGTAGALSLLPEKPTDPLIVMNGDLLTKVNFHHLLDFHEELNADATMGVREYDLEIPFGIVQIENHQILNIDEKPMQSFFVNAGIYVLDPKVLDLIPKNSFYDMPDLFNKLLQKKYKTAAFPIREYWLDIGRMEDLVKANGEVTEMLQ